MQVFRKNQAFGKELGTKKRHFPEVRIVFFLFESRPNRSNQWNMRDPLPRAHLILTNRRVLIKKPLTSSLVA